MTQLWTRSWIFDTYLLLEHTVLKLYQWWVTSSLEANFKVGGGGGLNLNIKMFRPPVWMPILCVSSKWGAGGWKPSVIFFGVSDLYLVQTGLLERSSCTASKNAAFQNLSDCQIGCSLRKLYRKFLPWQPVKWKLE